MINRKHLHVMHARLVAQRPRARAFSLLIKSRHALPYLIQITLPTTPPLLIGGKQRLSPILANNLRMSAGHYGRPCRLTL